MSQPNTAPLKIGSSKKGPATKPKPKLIPNVTNGSKDPVEVYCRLRPLKNDNDCACIKRLDDNTLQLIPFSNNKLESFYTFKYVFPEDTSQKELFDKIGLPLIKDLVGGKNGLLFTYGITSSGKTFTVTGNSQDCGLLPRTLDVLFNSIKENLSRRFVFKPDAQNGFTIRSTPDALLEWQREKQVSRTPSAITSTPRVKRREVDDLKEWDQRERDSNKIELESKGNAFAVFVSYVEIYNNYIYDLLDDDILIDPIKMKQPQSKVLREDKRRRVFVWLAKEVEVTSSEEAFDLFVKGVRRRRMAHTALNTESSRSHSVFNIKVVQAPLDAEGEVIQDEKFLTVSQLALVDLAGSERTQRTQNIGERLREAGNINNSLMALRNCIELLRENQKYGTNKMIPYRDNKLTHLFKSYFEGEGKIKMVLCVNPGSEDFDETLHVMKFAETAQEVLINRANDIPFHLKMPHPYSSSRFIPYPNVDCPPAETVGPPLPLFTTIDFRDKKQLADLIEILELRKKNTLRHFEHIRQKQMLFRESLMTAENENMLTKQQLKVIRNDLDVRESQVKSLESKCCQLEGEQEDYMRKIYSLERHLREVEEQLDRKNQALSHAGVEQIRTKASTEEKIAKEKERLKRIFERVLKEKQAQLEREQCLTKEKMHLVKEILTADNSDWGLFREYWDSMYPNLNAATPSTSTPSKNKNSVNSNTGGNTGFHVRRPSVPESSSRTLFTATPELLSTPSSSKRLKLASDQGTSLLATPTLIPNYPDFTPENIENRNRTKSTPGIPVVNPRHIRSLSTGNEKWLDHRPQSDLDMGTILKPKMKNKLSVSNLKKVDADNLRRMSKYAITTHDADDMGDVETRIFKGDVIPSVSGGAQVIFNDVETMVQSPPL